VDNRERVKIVESYVDYKPTLNYRNMVERLLATVPEKYLIGLDSVVLCNFSGLPQREKVGKIRRKKNRFRRDNVAGLYKQAWRGQPAWIQLFVDKIDMPPRPLRWIRPLSDLAFGSVLYHELGHHAHRLRPEFHDKEDVAESWSTRFAVNHVKKVYWYFYVPMKLIALTIRWIRTKATKPLTISG
jgi:hypothetical protein